MSLGRPKRVLILEGVPVGHHPFYVRLLLQSELANSAKLILASPREMFDHPALVAFSALFQRHQIELGTEFELQSASSAALMRRSWNLGRLYRRTFIELSKSAPIDFVIVPYLDNCLMGLAAPSETFFGTAWLALTMRTMFHYPTMGVAAPKQSFTMIRRLLIHRILKQKSTAAILTTDPTLAEFAEKRREPWFGKIRYVPDPVSDHHALPSKEAARHRLNIPTQARVVLLYGEIGVRKGASLLVEAAAAPACSQQILVLLAGRYWGPKELLNSQAWQSLAAQGRIHAVNSLIDDELEQLLLAAADCMWIGYTDFYGVSGVMALAGRYAIPVLASEYGLVGHFARKYQLGAIIDPWNQSSIVAALNRLVNEPEFFERAGRNGVPVYQHHTPIALQRVVTDIVERSVRDVVN
jgi:hypothetical protein